MARILVIGLWHLGSVVCGGLAHLGHRVIGTDLDENVVRKLQQGQPLLHEPGLHDLIAQECREQRLQFRPLEPEAFVGAEHIFITFDTPVHENDQSDLTPVEKAVDAIAAHAKGETQVVVMSQVPVGTCQRLAARLRQTAPKLAFTLVYQPENLRLGDALKTFLEPDVIVVGAEDEAAARHLLELYRGIEAPRLTMSWRSAEMAKHALNAFLATSISYVNELADLAEASGADVRDVVRVLRQDRRIGPHAFLTPGPGFSGGTLARDVQTLRRLGRELTLATPQLDATWAVNCARLGKVLDKIRRICGSLQGRRMGLLGLTYKPGTSTLRRSHALALARLLQQQGSEVRAFDPQVTEPKPETEGIILCPDPYDMAECADAVVLTTPWPEFRNLDLGRLRRVMRQPVVIDLHNFLDDRAVRQAGLRYSALGIPELTETRPDGE